MDSSVDKELAGRSHAESSGQWLNVQMEISGEWCHCMCTVWLWSWLLGVLSWASSSLC